MFGRDSCVSLFVRRGADINQKSIEHQRTALHLAAQHGKENIVNLLLDLGANTSASDKLGCTALHAAAQYG
jgi:ankyrin repeat protein